MKVIKAQLDAQPDGELPNTGSAYGVPRLVPVSGQPAEIGAAVVSTQVRLSREDLLARSGVDDKLLTAWSRRA